MNDDPLLNEDNTSVDFNEIPLPPGIEQAIKEPIIKEQRPAGMGNAPSPEQQEKPRVESRRYEVDGTGITVNYETLHPSEEAIKKREKAVREREEEIKKRQIVRELKGLKSIEEKPYKPAIPEGEPDQAVIFLPGWSLDAGTKSARKVGQAFADAGIRKVFVVDVKPDRVVDDTLYKEAEAIAKLVKDSGVKRLTISGYSEGGVRAINLAVILQKQYPEIVVDGVVLIESMGLYDQGSKKGFVGKFGADSVVTPFATGKDTGREILTAGKHFAQDSYSKLTDREHKTERKYIQRIKAQVQTGATELQVGTDVLFGMMKEVRRMGRDYRQRVQSQIREMINIQTHLGEVRVPVILVQGVDDLVSNPEKVIPGYKNLGRMATDEATNEQYDPREKFLQEDLFPESPDVRLVTGEKSSHHAITILRAEQIAKDSLYLLERFKREQAPIQSQPTSGGTV